MEMIGAMRMPGRLHVDEQEADAVLPPRRAFGAHQAEHPVGMLRVGGPDLRAVDDVVVAGLFGARLQRRQVRAGAGFRVTLAPPVLRTQDARQEALLLLGVAVLDDHRPDHLQAEGQGVGRAHRRAFDVVDVALRRRPFATTMLPGPARCGPAAFEQAALPFDDGLRVRGLGVDARGQFGRPGLLQEGAHLGAEGGLFGGERNVHGVSNSQAAWYQATPLSSILRRTSPRCIR